VRPADREDDRSTLCAWQQAGPFDGLRTDFSERTGQEFARQRQFANLRMQHRYIDRGLGRSLLRAEQVRTGPPRSQAASAAPN